MRESRPSPPARHQRHQRRRALAFATILPLAGLLAVSALPGCARLLGPRTVEVSREALLAKLGQRFPATQRVMNLLDVSASTPTLEMLPEANRVAARIPIKAHELLMGQDHHGLIALSFGLRFEPQDLSVRLTQVKIEQVQIDGLAPLFQRSLNKMGAAFAEERLQDQIVHRFKPEDLRTADRLGYEVDHIRVTATGLAIDLKPRP
jgi:hypothetical protein